MNTQLRVTNDIKTWDDSPHNNFVNSCHTGRNHMSSSSIFHMSTQGHTDRTITQAYHFTIRWN